LLVSTPDAHGCRSDATIEQIDAKVARWIDKVGA
jgi:hypothetical protein